MTRASVTPALGYFESSEKDVSKLRTGRDKFTHQKEEAPKCPSLKNVKPWIEIDVSVGLDNADETQDGLNGDQCTDLEDSGAGMCQSSSKNW